MINISSLRRCLGLPVGRALPTGRQRHCLTMMVAMMSDRHPGRILMGLQLLLTEVKVKTQ